LADRERLAYHLASAVRHEELSCGCSTRSSWEVTRAAIEEFRKCGWFWALENECICTDDARTGELHALEGEEVENENPHC
jgi:hypothetical protein